MGKYVPSYVFDRLAIDLAAEVCCCSTKIMKGVLELECRDVPLPRTGILPRTGGEEAFSDGVTGEVVVSF